MSIVNPLTTSRDIQPSLAPKTALPDKEKPIKPDLGIFSADLVELSRLGIEKQKRSTSQCIK
ncbi:MAG: hypothetical protein ACI9U0_000661 [Flavobacteriales bacterium]|jgi:hypothetical protein